MPTETESYDEQYLLSKQLGHEIYSPQFQVYNKEFLKLNKAQEEQFAKDLATQGVPQEEIDASLGDQAAEPTIDPVTAFASGAAATGKAAITAGVKLLPSLQRSVTSGTLSALSEYPIGLGAEAIETKYPKLSVPFTIVAGVASGVFLESRIEKAVKQTLEKTKGSIAEGLIRKEAIKVRHKLETGVYDESTKDVVELINKGVEDLTLDDIFKSKSKVGTGVPKRGGKAIGPETETKFQNLESDLRGKKYAGDVNINLERIQSSDDIKKLIDKTATLFKPEINKARRGVQSHAMTQKVADSLGMTTETLLKRRKGEAFNDAQALSARNILVSSADNLTALSKRIQSLDATDIDRYEFRKALNLHYAIQAQVSGATAEAGRALQSFRIPSKSSEIKVREIKELLENTPGSSVEDLSKMILDMDSMSGLNTFVRQAQTAKTSDMLLEAWINGLLSGPQTHAVNTLSNTLTAIWQIPERFLASGISKVAGDNAIGVGEAGSQIFGLVEGSKDGLKAFLKSVKTGEVSDAFSKLETDRFKAITAENIAQLPIMRKIAPDALEEGGLAARFVDFLGEGVRVPGRLLTAEDEFFKSIGYRMELKARAYRRAVLEEGLSGNPASQRINEIIGNPQELAPDLHLASIDAARYQTFTKPLGPGGKALNKFLNSHPYGRVIVPFLRTPTNILKFAGERTPLAFLSKNVRDEIAAGGARRDLALAKVSMGSAVMGLTAAATMEGHVTGAGPTNPAMRSLKRDTGWQPYSIKLGDKYYAYNRLEPLGMILGMAADFTEIAGDLNENERDELSTAIVGAIAQNITSKTWLRGVSEVLSAFEDPQRYGAKWWQNMAASVVPTGVAQLERVMSPEMSAINSTMDAMKARIPGYSNDMPPRRNMWAEIITPEGGLGPDIISPIYTSTKKDSPISQELIDLRVPLEMPSRTQHFDAVPIKLEPEEYDRFLVLMNEIPLSTGRKLKDSLNYLVTKDPNYRLTRDPEIKEMRIRSLITEARSRAKQRLKDEFEILNYIISDEKLKKQNLR